jgi:hypothetical protein
MKSTIHLNEQMQYTSQPQHVVWSHRDQDETWTFVVPKQPHEISKSRVSD